MKIMRQERNQNKLSTTFMSTSASTEGPKPHLFQRRAPKPEKSVIIESLIFVYQFICRDPGAYRRALRTIKDKAANLAWITIPTSMFIFIAAAYKFHTTNITSTVNR